MLEEHLAMAERHISQGEAAIVRQSALAEEMTMRGLDGSEAQRLLTEFRRLLYLHKQDRDRIRAELGLPPK